MTGDEELRAAVLAVTDPVIRTARTFGPLPQLRSRAFLDAPDAVKLAVLLVLGEAWIVGDSLLDEWATEDYAGGRYHRQHLIPAIGELNRRRYPPTGDRALWVRYGPDGPPAADSDRTAA